MKVSANLYTTTSVVLGGLREAQTSSTLVSICHLKKYFDNQNSEIL
jgi:hypothetical protein